MPPTHTAYVRNISQVNIRRAKNVADFGKAWEESRKMAEQMGIKNIGAYGLLGR